MDCKVMMPAQPNQRALFWRLVRQVQPCWPHLTGLFLLSLLAPPLALLTPLPLKIAFDSVLDTHPLPPFLEAVVPESLTRSDAGLIGLVVGLLIFVALLTQVRDFVSAVLSAYTGEKLLRSFRAQLFHHVQRLSLSYHDTTGTADSLYRIQNDAQAMRSLVIDGFMPSVSAFAMLASMIEGVMVLDCRGKVLQVNPALEQMLMVQGAEARGRAHWEVIRHHELNELVTRVLQTRENCGGEMTATASGRTLITDVSAAAD